MHEREHGVAEAGPSAAATAIARMIAGNAKTRSAMRMIDLVDQPPK